MHTHEHNANTQKMHTLQIHTM